MEKYNENRFVLQLCKIKTYDREQLLELIDEGLDYPYILGHLLYNRIAGVAYTVLKQANILWMLNREFRNSIQMIYDSNCVRHESYMKTLSYLSSLLKDINIPYALLKGAFLNQVYKKGIRISNDVDVLVNQNNITEITTILKKNGFKQGNVRSGKFVEATRLEILSSRINRGETVPFIKEINLPQMKFCEIDINFSFDYRAKQENNMVEDFLYNAQPAICTDNAYMNTLSSTCFLIQLCMHLYKEATIMNWVKMGRDVSLYKYMDIYVYIVEFFNANFAKEFILLVKKYGLENECYYTLYYTKLLFDISNECLDNILESIEPTDLDFLNQIYDPETRKKYKFNIDYIEWVFSSKKLEKLNEVTNG